MKEIVFVSLIVSLFFIFSCGNDDENPPITMEEIVTVANRASGSISFINSVTEEIETTLSIDGSEPMYIVNVPSLDKLYVGDRAQNQVHVVNLDSREVEASIDVGDGVFHMWADGQGSQLWVNNDVDNSVSIIDLSTNTVSNTLDIGEKPHDVFLNSAGTIAYISVLLGDATVPDKVYAYNTSTLEQIASKEVGDDPHLYHISSTNRLYVPNQSGALYVLNGNDLSEVSVFMLEGAHGIFPTLDNEHLIITNLPGSQIYSFSTENNTHQEIDTDIGVPHNVTVNESGSKAYVTHSGGTANQVSVYDIGDGTLSLNRTHTVQNNPFGIAYYRREK